MSQQAFSKARNNFDHSPFEKMVRKIVKDEYISYSDELPTLFGYHILAVDGSYLQLPRTAKLAEEYGVRGRNMESASAGISVLFDVLHGWPIDPCITHTNMDERGECKKHIEYLHRELPEIASNSLLLLDRGYPSEGLFRQCEYAGIKFLARCKRNFSKNVQKAPMGDSTVTLPRGMTVRVYKFKLKSGEIETLLTNAFDIPGDDIPNLYNMRWGIETYYARLKNQVCIENFSGKTGNAIRQDFWASMILMIGIAVFEKPANESIQNSQQGKNNKLSYKVNTADLVVTLRNEFIFEVFRENKVLDDNFIKKIVSQLAYSKSPIRPGRSFPRHKGRSSSFNLNAKSHL